MAFGQDFLQGFFGVDGLKTYSHASKTFTTNGYELAPRNKFLFHVYFNLNTSEIPALRSVFPESDKSALGLLVKNIQLPAFSIDSTTLNQYNRKRIIQSKINYQPIQIEFHDDTGDLSRSLWYNYYSYNFKDPNQQYGSTSATNGSIGPVATQPGFSYNSRDIYAANRPVSDWGFIGESFTGGGAGSSGGQSGGDNSSGKPPFFRDIVIYGLSQHKFASYTLINPLIKEWRHDTYDYNQGSGTMGNTCVIEFETVKYYEGAIGSSRPDTNVKGFADPAYYDTVPSALSRPGATRSVLGQGGLLDAGIGIIEDLQSGGVAGVLGAIQKAGTVYGTWKDAPSGTVSEEIRGAVKTTIQTGIPSAVRQQQAGTGGFTFPK